MAVMETVPVGQMVTLIDEDGTILTTMLTDEEAKNTEIDPNMAHGLMIRARNELCLTQQSEVFDDTSNVPEENEASVGEGMSLLDGSTFVWSHQMTMYMLTEYRKRKSKFRDSTQKKNKTWDEVAKAVRLKHNDAYFTGEACDRKFRNMMATYRKVKWNRNKTGKMTRTWRYFEFFDQIFGNENDVLYKPTPSNSPPPVAPTTRTQTSIMAPKGSLPVEQRDDLVESDSNHSSFSSSICSGSDIFGSRTRFSSDKRKRRRLSESTSTDLIDKILVQQKEMMARLEEMHAENLQLAKERNELLRILNERLHKRD